MNKTTDNKIDLVKINKVNRLTYDQLSKEYENRTDKVFDITKRVIDLFSKYLKTGAEVLDTGCAVGLAMKIMTDKRLSVTGIDISSKMVRLAKLRNPKCRIIKGDFLKYRFNRKYDGIFSFAFIHLFPKETSITVLEKMYDLLEHGGVLYLGTSKSKIGYEGFEIKKDYKLKLVRFRKHWTEPELRLVLENVGFRVLKKYILVDPYKKVWMDFVATKI